jgi:hypothetical protein
MDLQAAVHLVHMPWALTKKKKKKKGTTHGLYHEQNL